MSTGAIVAIVILAIIVFLVVFILSVKATVTIKHENGWSTRIKILFIERDIVLSELLSFVLFPERKAKQVADADAKKKQEKQKEKQKAKEDNVQKEVKKEEVEKPETEPEQQEAEKKTAEQKPAKSNPIKKLWDEEGIVGMLTLLSNVIETANSAILTLFRGLHIYTLYVMILVGGGDADVIARKYGTICSYFYPIKGFILNGMRVDKYEECLQPDFVAEYTEFQMELSASISVGLLVKMLLKAGIVFVKNLIKNKKGNK